MIATTVLPSPMLRVSSVAIVLVQKFLMAAGLVFILGFVAVQSGHSRLIEELRAWLPDQEVSEVLEADAESGLAPGEVRIRSAAAGTEIVLRNNGRIDINGLLFINGMPYLGMGG